MKNPEHIGCINPLRYRGYYCDQETGLYYLNARYYDPVTGRFINADSTLSGGLNLFAYCYNNTVCFSDWTGKDARLDKYIFDHYRNKYTVTFMVCAPVPGSRQVTSWRLNDDNNVGHVFLRLDDGRGHIEYIGFYPDAELSDFQILTNASVPGKFDDDSRHPWTIAKIYEISVTQARAIADFLGSFNKTYNMTNNNCTTFAVKALESIGIEAPTRPHWWNASASSLSCILGILLKKHGYSPADAAEDIREIGGFILCDSF